MKKLLTSSLLIVLVLLGCSKKDDPIAKVCSATTVTIIDNTATQFSFQESSPGTYRLHQIIVYFQTDSAYQYNYSYDNDGKLNILSRFQDGQNADYNVTLDGGKVSKLTYTTGGINIEELRLVYAGDNLTDVQDWYGNATGTLFEVGNTTLSYENGNMTKSDTYLDIAALFTLAFGSDPSGYAPTRFLTNVYTFSDSPNPLKGIIYFNNPDLGAMSKVPLTITNKDLNNAVIFSDTYTITKDGNGNATTAVSGSKHMDALYVCQQ